jgi:acetyl-CoA synthetase (ADP-forming)
VIPVERRDAQEMIKEIKGYPLLQAYRGKEPANISALVEIILKISKLIEENPQIKELELNPIFAFGDKAVAVDARIILEKV